jgi:RimJ/RimL family protein N-acetyltransferase
MIKGKGIDLRLIKEDDIELLRNWRNVYSHDFFTNDQITKQQQRAWYIRYSDNSGKDWIFIIQLKDSTPVGTIALYNLDNADRIATIGRILLLEGYRGQGLMTEALELIIDMAFNKMRLWKLKLGTYLDNAAVIALYSKVGFKSTKRPIMLMELQNMNINPDQPLELMDLNEGD